MNPGTAEKNNKMNLGILGEKCVAKLQRVGIAVTLMLDENRK